MHYHEKTTSVRAALKTARELALGCRAKGELLTADFDLPDSRRIAIRPTSASDGGILLGSWDYYIDGPNPKPKHLTLKVQ
jgi:hypothetical protein